MKKKCSALLLALLMTLSMTAGCDSSDDDDSKSTSKKASYSSTTKTSTAKTSTVKTTSAAKVNITKSEAIRKAKAAVEAKLSSGSVIGGDKKASKYSTVLYGTENCVLKDGAYTVTFKGTCWAKDAYGKSLGKYEFDVEVTVKGYTGNTSITLDPRLRKA